MNPASIVKGLGRAAALALVALGASAATGHTAGEGAASPLKVVATTAMVGDLAANIGGERVKVTNLMGEGVDPHLYKATPGDVRLLSDADVILYNGLHLEGRMADVIVRMAGKRTVVRVTESIDEDLLREPPEFEGHYDPHVWFDVSLWSRAAERVRDALIEKDPAGKAEYERRAGEYLATLGELHEYARATLATIPPERRVLVTAHDAFGYFGAAYGLEVHGIQGISTDSEASLREVSALVQLLAERRVPAVFIESSVPRKTVDALVEGCRARGHSVTIGGELYSDAMGAPGTFGGTYVGMIVHNVETIAAALGGEVPPSRPARVAAVAERFGAPAERK